ncbi:MAG: YfcC family protein, partial [Bacteroidales bacterium]|nr:YfcC family protein [Bacteroidales bacterium]
PSGSAKAALTIPMMAEFADMLHISRQTMVLAFQFGDGITNMITPASGVLLGCLGAAKIPYSVWVKWIWKFILFLIVLGFLLLLPTLYFSFNGF